jgi:RNA 2',3'-cyclic 3'-phosphodiesterase
VRCFIALGLEDGPASSLAPWLESTRELFPELAVSPAGNLHLTLAFLGETGAAAVEAAGAAVLAAAAGRRSWTLRWSGAGVFPGPSRPRVMWLGVDGVDALVDAHQALVTALSESGLPVEDRPYRPHLTLARVRRPGLSPERRARVIAHLDTLPTVEASRVVSLVLYQSRLGGGPTVHVPLVTAPFA